MQVAPTASKWSRVKLVADNNWPTACQQLLAQIELPPLLLLTNRLFIYLLARTYFSKARAPMKVRLARWPLVAVVVDWPVSRPVSHLT